MVNLQIKSTLLAIGGFLLVFVGVFYKGKKAGREKEKNKQKKVIEKNVKKAKTARDNITDAKRNQLRRKFKRR